MCHDCTYSVYSSGSQWSPQRDSIGSLNDQAYIRASVIHDIHLVGPAAHIYRPDVHETYLHLHAYVYVHVLPDLSPLLCWRATLLLHGLFILC